MADLGVPETSSGRIEADRIARRLSSIWGAIEAIGTPVAAVILYVVYPHLDAFVDKSAPAFKAIMLFVALVLLAGFAAIKFSIWKQAKRLAKLHLEIVQGFDEASSLMSDIPGPNAASFEIMGKGLRVLLRHWAARPGGEEDFSITEVREYVLHLLSSAARFLEQDPGGGDQRTIRCGLLIPDSEGRIVPCLVYDPAGLSLQSEQRFAADSVPARLFANFPAWALQDNHEVGEYIHIQDVDTYRAGNEDYGKVEFVNETEKPKIKSLLCVMLYVKVEGGRMPIAILSFDSPEKGGISLERYKETLPILRVIYRLLLIRVLASNPPYCVVTEPAAPTSQSKLENQDV